MVCKWGTCQCAGGFWAPLAVARSKVPCPSRGIMARSSWKVLSVAAALIALYNFCNSLSFVPGPLRKHAPVAAASAAGMMMAPAAFADEIGDAAKKLGDASYDFAKEVDWNNGIFLQAPGKFQPLEALKAIDKMIDMGAAADPKLLKAAAEAHHKAIGSISGPNGVTSRADWDEVNAALGRVVASVPKAKVMDVYNAVKDITDPGVPAYMKSLVNGADAEKAYKGFLEFKDVVEKQLGIDQCNLFISFSSMPSILIYLYPWGIGHLHAFPESPSNECKEPSDRSWCSCHCAHWRQDWRGCKGPFRCILPILERGAGFRRTFFGVIVIVFLFAGDAWEVNWESSSVMFCLTVLFMAMPCLLPSCLFIVIIEQNAECWIARYCSCAQPSGGLAV